MRTRWLAPTAALAGALTLAACGREPRAAADSPAAAAAPTATAAAAPSVAHPAWSRGAAIYEVNLRQYTPEGTLAAFQRHLPRLKALGVDILWLMPVQPIGRKNRKGPLGSYYSIADYRAVNPEFGTAADFRAVVDAAHAQGLKVLLDWVPNHTAFDHPWITQHPDWYVHKPDGSVSNARDNENHDTDWTDVAELNYDSPQLRQAMLGEMRFWLDSMRVDGFRCDVAGGVPTDFWVDARRQLAAGHPDLFMLAEAEDPALHQAFDMTYGWEFHHLLNEVAQGRKGARDLDAYFARDAARFPADAYRMYFTSNHDENSWNGTEFERMGANAKAAFVLAATAVRGMPLLYTGQEVSMKKRLRFFEKDTVDWNGPSLADFYRAVLDLKEREPALAAGAAGGAQETLRTDGGDRVYAFTRTRDSNTVLVALNFGDLPATMRVEMLARPGAYTDWFDRSKATVAAGGSLTVPAHGWRVLVRE